MGARETVQRVSLGFVPFLRACREIVGEAGITDGEAYQPNVSGLRRLIPAAVHPTTTDQVAAIARAASRWGVALYPISKGRNWGFGSRLPVRSGSVVLDLGRMNRIRRIDDVHGCATIEPGVTQGQLANHLLSTGAPFFLDVTGAGTETSILGNALERGIAYNSLRCETIRNLEVVLADGTVVRTGFGHIEGARTADLYTHGIGPGLDGLFMQSNMGIVTGATVDLMPMPEAEVSFTVSLPESALSGAMDAIRELMSSGTLRCITHIANRKRMVQSLEPDLHRQLAHAGFDDARTAKRLMDQHFRGEWTLVASVRGDRQVVRAQRSKIVRALRPHGRCLALSKQHYGVLRRLCTLLGMRKTRALIDATEEFRGLTHGTPTDAALSCIGWTRDASPPTADPDQGWGGLLFCVPLAPLGGREATELSKLAETTCGQHGFEPAITLNALTSRVLEAVVSIDFDRRDHAGVRAAHACMADLHEAYLGAGLPPYRVGIEHMQRIVEKDEPFWETVATLKRSLDPSGVLAPGRYAPVS